MAEPTEAGVTFTVKEMLAQIDSKIDTIDAKLDSKVERVEFNVLQGVVEDLKALKFRAFGALGAVAFLCSVNALHIWL